MKIKYLILILILAMAGCKKEPVMFDGTVTAKKNDKKWKGECNVINLSRLGFENEIDISLYRFNNAGFERENFHVTRVSVQIGKINVIPYKADSINNIISINGASYYTLTDDGCAIDDTYYLLETAENILEITKLDEQTNEIEGKFNLTFYRNPEEENPNPNSPDTVCFTNGEFKAIITPPPTE